MTLRKAIFLDRDGTLIIDKIYLNNPDKIEYLPHVFEALKKLAKAGYIFIVVTNQSGVARGLVQIENIEEIHRRISHAFELQGVSFAGYYYAPFSVESNHWMRKPNPGMLEKAASDHQIDLKQSWMIGDRMSDIVAGHAAGCRSILLPGEDTSSAAGPLSVSPDLCRQPEAVCTDLLKAAHFILQT
jgi:D-glycero-D-manno-heptose 1,7-bisphosphate phosphatase